MSLLQIIYVSMGVVCFAYAALEIIAPDVQLGLYGQGATCPAAYETLKAVAASNAFIGVLLLQAATMNADGQKKVARALIPYGAGLVWTVYSLLGNTSYTYFGLALSASPIFLGLYFGFIAPPRDPVKGSQKKSK